MSQLRVACVIAVRPFVPRWCVMMPELGAVSVRDPNSVLPDGFWAAIAVWLEKPQVLNKRLCGSSIQETWQEGGCEPEELRGLLDLLSALSCPGEDEEMVDMIRGYGESGAGLGTSIILRTLIPKANPHYASTAPKREAVIQDIPNRRVTFIPLEGPNQGHLQVKKNNIYQIRLEHVKDDEWSISLFVLYSESWDADGVVYPKVSWMKNELLSRLTKWSTEDKKSEFKSTLSLVSVDKYSKLYQSLKEKYKDMVKVWPEVTDPEKFVYEDVAIATYLLVLWEDERLQKNLNEKQSFVDLGCGNGLLVHILTNEGHRGRGIDVRRRKIWDMYGPETILEECAIIPSDEYLFPDTDWIIGNHSDELTPWLPVIASRSSYSCCYFVLPCCFFSFYGKYNRKSSKKTQYREYLDFVTEVGHRCGFNVEEDCLRIPSTKRVCLIGKSRTYLASQEGIIDQERKQYIKSHFEDNKGSSYKASPCHLETKGNCNGLVDHADESSTTSTAARVHLEPENGVWLSGFQPREKVEPVRNCALLPRTFIDKVVLQVANLLLNSDAEEKTENIVDAWNRGGCVTLMEVAEHLDKETLQRLKNECGGLQTLLRNNHQVFEVRNAKVSIRDWRQEAKTATSQRRAEAKRILPADVLKTRLCWFYVNHPSGCPRVADSCPYAHGSEELRPSSITKKHRHK
ncbi:probable tRNA (uracil-O(2)-)-methyltransferase [Spea bombifrons]|uniref:probable tRNA (uracil-O(2)-)-methyltransferase n=1 Tax=Spea bombifrons TaxID=233779 RepID=UPI00234A0137|nr:probable tRNA (uracil-O(2)-)-methyltransferase [Spea bombifrons]